MNGKGIAALILAKRPPPKPEEDAEMQEGRYHDAAGDVLAAIKDRDAEALSQALRSFVSMCSYSESGE